MRRMDARRPFAGTFRVPGSKAESARALVAAALARGVSRLVGLSDSDDTRRMVEGLRRAGVPVERTPEGARLEGLRGPPRGFHGEIDAGGAGTVLRFLLPLLAAGTGRARFVGSPRLAQRPIAPLLEALVSLGASIEGRTLPIDLAASGLHGGAASLASAATSQFASGLLLAAPAMRDGLALTLEGAVLSRPYLDLTCRVLRDFGVPVERPDDRTFVVAPGGVREAEVRIDGDGGAASFLLAAGAITGGRVAVEGLRADTGEPDARIAETLAGSGCRVTREGSALVLEGPAVRPVDADLSRTPDLLPPLAVVAATIPGPSRLRGVPQGRWKESDRIAALAEGLRRCGVPATEGEDGLRIDGGGARLRGAEIDPRGDHRIAMAFAVLGLRTGDMRIRDPGCVSKSFPGFFEVLGSSEDLASPRAPGGE